MKDRGYTGPWDNIKPDPFRELPYFAFKSWNEGDRKGDPPVGQGMNRRCCTLKLDQSLARTSTCTAALSYNCFS